ncbi:MAG: patatin-like phospholipase family protein [Balneolales bacterium]|nr:patatin-like phospholipase family protein [Balneolales bacterium]
MARELRLAMAMGGGVSLGTFSGGALTQSLKLLFINNLIKWINEEDSYDRIVIDAFSGASAGALSLTLMLRAMCFPEEGVLEAGAELNTRLKAKLHNEFGDGFEELWRKVSETDKNQLNQLLLIQYAQDLQEQAWVNTVNLERLLRRDKLPSDMERFNHDPSILYLKTYEDIAALYLAPGSEGYTGSLNPTGILGDNVTFACSLSRLNPVVADGRKQYEVRQDKETGLISLNDALRSFIHRDMRVFDIHFKDLKSDKRHINSLPNRWYRFHTGEADTQSERHILENIRDKNSWQTITATAIACGCFPVAFRPVLLERHRCEFGDSLWPKQFDGLDENTDQAGSFSNHRYPFTYVDGGMFNNEPLREAFRLAYYQDTRHTDIEYDRRVLFVDPIVSDDIQPLGLSMYTRFGSNESQNAFRKKGSLLGLMHAALAVGGAIKNQARVNETDKVFAKRDEFELRDKYRADFLKMSEVNLADLSKLRSLAKECSDDLENKRLSDKLSSVQTNLRCEIRRIIFETEGIFDDLIEKTDDFVDWVSKTDTSWPFPDLEGIASKWYKLLMLSRLDIMMDMEGVDNRAKLISISPHKITKTSDSSNQIVYQTKPVQLKGSAVFAFSGFMSDEARSADFASGKWAAFHFLSFQEGFDSTHPLFQGLGELPDQKVDFTQSLKRSAKQLSLRLNEMVGQGSKDLRFWSGSKWIRLFSRLIPLLVSRFLNEEKLEEMLISQLESQKQFHLSLLITGEIRSFSLVAANNRWKRFLPKFGLDPVLQNEIENGLRSGGWQRSISSQNHWPFNDSKEADKRQCIAVDMKATPNTSESIDWESRYVSHGYMLLDLQGSRYFLIKLPEASYLRKHGERFNGVLTLDLSAVDSASRYSLIDASSWLPARHLFPSDDKRVFDF